MSKNKRRDVNYFVFTCYGAEEPTSIIKSPHLPGGPWMDGRPLRIRVPKPLVYELDSNHPGEILPMYEDEAVPPMRDDLIEALKAAGATNIQTYPAVIKDPFSKREHKNFKAVNILGLVACADRKKSALMGTSDSKMIDVDYAALVIDERKTQGKLLFRLAEAVNAIVVHRKVREEIEKRKLPFLTFQGPGEWAG